MFLGKRRSLVLIFFVAFSLILWGGGPQAAPERVDSPQENIAVILLIDTSGSMRTTDPQRLRETAAHIFIDLLSPEDYLGLITFDHEANVVLPLQKVGSSAHKELFKERLSPRLEPRGNTDFTRALEVALEQFRQTETGGVHPVAVLLTDGEPEPSPRHSGEAFFMESYMQTLWETVGSFALEGCPLYTVGFGNEIDPEIIQRISLDTKGEYYLLNEPAELLVSFFELLGNLKNRRGFLGEIYTLEEGQAVQFDFLVDEHTRQVNLVAAGLTGGRCVLTLTPPQEGDAGLSGLTIKNEDDYSMAILHQPGQAYWGKWQGNISGQGPVRVLGDRDLFIKAWLEEPLPSSQHPLYEALHFKVRVTGTEQPGGFLRVELQLKKPGQEQPVNVLLGKEGSFFTGSYAEVDQVGTYELLLHMLLDDEVVATSASKLYVKPLPVLETDFGGEGRFRRGEDVIVTASLNLGGRRLPAGDDLKVKDFNLLLQGEDGAREVLALFDDGNLQHGDFKAGDGIWSNCFVFEREGTMGAVLQVRGSYRGTEFFLEKNLVESTVFAPGKVLLSLPRPEAWSMPGKNVVVPLQLMSKSDLRETIVLVEQVEAGRFVQSRIALEPGESKVVRLNLNLYGNLNPGVYQIPLTFSPDSALTVLDPSHLELDLEIVTPGQAFIKKTFHLLAWVAGLLVVLGAAGLVFYVAGMLFYRLLVFPRKRVRGTLFYRRIRDDAADGGKKKKEGAGESPPEAVQESPQSLYLGSLRKEKIIISFDPENPRADFHLGDGEFAYDLLLESVWERRRPSFLQGWQALLKKQLPVKTMLECTPPGVFEYAGGIYTCREIFHSDRFVAGGFHFEYSNPERGWFRDKARGANILEGKV